MSWNLKSLERFDTNLIPKVVSKSAVNLDKQIMTPPHKGVYSKITTPFQIHFSIQSHVTIKTSPIHHNRSAIFYRTIISNLLHASRPRTSRDETERGWMEHRIAPRESRGLSISISRINHRQQCVDNSKHCPGTLCLDPFWNFGYRHPSDLHTRGWDNIQHYVIPNPWLTSLSLPYPSIKMSMLWWRWVGLRLFQQDKRSTWLRDVTRSHKHKINSFYSYLPNTHSRLVQPIFCFMRNFFSPLWKKEKEFP